MVAVPCSLTCSAVVILLLLVIAVFAKKNDKLEELLASEKGRLEKGGLQCLEKQLRNVLSLRLKQPNDDLTLLCLISSLQNNPKDGFMWTCLGTAFDIKGKKYSSQASSCFKQAAKISGKFPTFIREWHYIGPFVIGKIEYDGDPLAAFGGISNASRFRSDSRVSYPSELLPHGKVKWTKVKQAGEKQGVKIAPNVNWNELVSSLGSMGITEWQGWAVGEMVVNADELTLMVSCLGVATVFIDGVPLAGDLYHREQFRFAVHLTRGVHQVSVKVRAKVQAVFECSMAAPPKEGFQVLMPSFQPDLYDGYLFSYHLALPVANHKSDKWLRVTKVLVSDQTSGEALAAETVNNDFSIAPGQTRYIVVKLVSSTTPQISEDCEEIDIGLTVKTTEGQTRLPITLRCRKKGDSFLFTFLDHDGSVQHAAAIEPLGSCPAKACPTLLTLHGTTVPPQNQADSYKRMVGGDFQFGVPGMWLLAPTRHGAHNWEGPGTLTAMTALETLASLTGRHHWLAQAAQSQHVLFQGHSMGGHGAWHLASHYPDRAVGLAALAGWIKKEEYGDSNLFFKHDIATSHTDAAVKAVMEMCIGENDADRHISNILDLPILCRIGANDRTVHPFFSRRMYRLLRERGSAVSYTELEGKEHWWWDTWETNDGGVVNDKQMRDFAGDCLSKHHSHNIPQQRPANNDDSSCSADGCHDDESKEAGGERWKRPKGGETQGLSELVTVNPALGEGLRGVRVLQQMVPFRTSKIKMNISSETAYLTTTNVRRFSLKEPANRRVQWLQKQIVIDQKFKATKEDTETVLKSNTAHFCKAAGEWKVCSDEVHQDTQRGPSTLGPARRVAENEFLIIVGTQSEEETTRQILSYAVYIANLFLLTSDAQALVVRDVDVSAEQMENMNLILFGGPGDNKHTQTFLSRIPVVMEGETVTVGSCSFQDTRQGVMSLAPNGARHLALVLMATTLEGLADIVSLATPTIPPMARSPFSNLLPDFVVTGDDYRQQGPGGFLCAGFWGNQWDLRQELISCACG